MLSGYAIVNGKSPYYDQAQKNLASEIERQMARGGIPQGGIIFVGLVTEGNTTNFVFSQGILYPPESYETHKPKAGTP